MSKIAIVYFSGYGHTAKVAEEVRQGASTGGAEVSMHRINAEGELSEADWAALNTADTIVYGSPTYMGGPAWQFKKFADASAKPWFGGAWNEKLAAGFTNSASTNGDKFSTMSYFWTLSQQHGQLWAGTGLLPANSKASTNADVNWTAGFGGLMTISPSDASVDESPAAGDLKTARLFGERLAQLTARWVR